MYILYLYVYIHIYTNIHTSQSSLFCFVYQVSGGSVPAIIQTVVETVQLTVLEEDEMVVSWPKT